MPPLSDTYPLPANDPKATHLTNRDPFLGMTLQVGASSTVPKSIRSSLRNSGPVPADIQSVEQIEERLGRSLSSEDVSPIYIGGGRFELVSSSEAQLWREERRARAEALAQAQEKEDAPLPSALIVGGALEPTFFRDLATASGVKTCRAKLTQFANGELLPRVSAEVMWKDLFLVFQSDGVSNDPLIELMLQVDAVRRAGASRITVVAPSFPYQRGDKKAADGTPIAAAAITRILQGQGVQQFICFDLHAGQAEGFSDVPITNLSALPLITHEIAKRHPGREFVVALPDEGMGKRLKDDKTRSIISENLGPNTSFLQMAKDRIEVNEVNSAHIKGGKIDLSGKIVLLLDDMIDTGNTMRMAARALLNAGADKILAAAAHGIFSGNAIENFREDRDIVDGKVVRPIAEIFVTDSVPLRRARGDLVHVVSLATSLGEVIKSLATKDGRSLTEVMLMHSGEQVM
jgi:ribose-phosphate pyrophosphokinase